MASARLDSRTSLLLFVPKCDKAGAGTGGGTYLAGEGWRGNYNRGNECPLMQVAQSTRALQATRVPAVPAAV